MILEIWTNIDNTRTVLCKVDITETMTLTDLFKTIQNFERYVFTQWLFFQWAQQENPMQRFTRLLLKEGLKYCTEGQQQTFHQKFSVDSIESLSVNDIENAWRCIQAFLRDKIT